MSKLYICVCDNQNADFHLGDTKTAKEWKEWAMSMNDFDEMDEQDQESFKKLSPTEAVAFVESMWDIEIVPFNPKDSEHIELKKWWDEEE